MRRMACFVVLASALAVGGCRCPQSGNASAGGRGSAEPMPGASSFAFFGGLKAFFTDEAPAQPVRHVSDADLTRADDAPVQTASPAVTPAAPTAIR